MTQPSDSSSRLPSEIFAAGLAERVERRRQKVVAEIARLEELTRNGPAEPGVYGELAGYHQEAEDADAAVEVLRKGLAVYPADAGLYWRLLTLLQELGREEEAIATARVAIERASQGSQFQLIYRLLLPAIYEDEAQVATFRARYARGVRECLDQVRTADREELGGYLEGMTNFVPFRLAYQGENDVELQRDFGALAHAVVRARYPQWAEPLEMPPCAAGERIRVGFVSRYFYSHTVARLFLGWLEHLDRARFEVYAYYTGRVEDPMTRRVGAVSDHFIHIAEDYEAMCRQIRADDLHLLIYTDIGMSSKTTMRAALRLAPVQCMAWGHPVTSGLPTIDYFLSSEAMEPKDAAAQYTERLITLPGAGIYVERPAIPRALLGKQRADWEIAEDAVVYLCCQALFKYLPRYDYVFAEVARAVPRALMVFLERRDVPVARFRARLARAFAERGLRYEDHCLILPAQSALDYWNLNLVSDIFLDSLGWSGGMTTIDAIACGLPVVTLPGKWMRGRHSYAMLTQMDVTETIAADEEEFINIARRLGTDPTWRSEVVERMAKASERLFGDRRSVRRLEDFISTSVRRADKIRNV